MRWSAFIRGIKNLVDLVIRLITLMSSLLTRITTISHRKELDDAKTEEIVNEKDESHK